MVFFDYYFGIWGGGKHPFLLLFIYCKGLHWGFEAVYEQIFVLGGLKSLQMIATYWFQALPISKITKWTRKITKYALSIELKWGKNSQKLISKKKNYE